jgi:hypothetical protein
MRVTCLCMALAAWLAGSAAADEASDRLFAQVVGTKPAFSLRAGDRIVGITHQAVDGNDAYRVTALRAEGSSWKKEAERALDEDDEAQRGVLDAFAAVTLGPSAYIYFALDVTRAGTANAGSGEIAFRLIDVQTLQPYTLVFWGSERGNGKIEGEFGPPNELARRPELLAFLKGKAAASPRIYHGETDAMSWVDDWKKMNASLPDASGVGMFRPVKLRWRYYDQNPMGDQRAASVAGTKESPEFKVLSYFRSSLIGYDKARRQYFPIWVESCAHGCNKEIRSLDGALLAFVFNEWDDDPAKVLYVDLEAGTVRMGPE